MEPDQIRNMECELAMTTGIIPRLIEKVNRNRVLAGMNTATDETEAGTFVHAEDQNPPGGTSTSAVPVRITGVHPDSPVGAGDVRMFRGDVYPDGSGESASTTAATIRVMGLAANIADYSTLPQIATPISQTWTKADTTEITETVYEVNPWTVWGLP